MPDTPETIQQAYEELRRDREEVGSFFAGEWYPGMYRDGETKQDAATLKFGRAVAQILDREEGE